MRDELELVTSVAQLEEVATVLARPKLRGYIDAEEAAQMIAAVQLRATVLDHVPVTKRSRDPDDDRILAVAVAGGAELVVSGDRRDMLILGDVEGIR